MKFLKASSFVTFFTFLSQALLAVKDIFLVSIFGVGEALDAFLLAILIPNFLISVLAGAFYSSLIPTLTKVRSEKGDAEAANFVTQVAAIALLFLSAVTVMLYLLQDYLLKIIFSETVLDLDLVYELYLILLPLLVIKGAFMFIVSLLNERKVFAMPIVVGFINPLVIILAGKFYNTFSVHDLVLLTLAASFVECFIVFSFARFKGYINFRFRFQNRNYINKTINEYTPMLGGMLLMASSTIVDQTMASWLGEGAVTTLSYANKIPSFVLGLMTVAIGVILLPYFSEMFARNELDKLKRSLQGYGVIILLTTIPLSALFMLFNVEVIEFVFNWSDNFNYSDSESIASVMFFYMMQIPFYVYGILITRLITVVGGNKYLMYIAVLSMLVNISMNFLLMKTMGAGGIALSTSIVYFVSCLVQFIVLSKLLNKARAVL